MKSNCGRDLIEQGDDVSAVNVLDGLIDRLFPNEKVEADWRTYLSRRGNSGALNLTFSGKRAASVSVPPNTPVHVYVKAFVTDPCSLGFGSFVAYASVGELTVHPTGIVEAEYCFANFYYAYDMDLVRIAFRRDYFSAEED